MRVSIVSLSALVGVVGPAIVAASCSSKASGSPGGDGGDQDTGMSAEAGATCVPFVSSANLTTPTVSFKSDVLPIFEHSCGLSNSCHGDPSDVPHQGVYLGCDMANNLPNCATSASSPCSCTQTNPGPDVYAQLVGLADAGPDGGFAVPLEETCMPFVQPGNPAQSYIMHKMDNDMCTLTCCVADNTALSNAMYQDPPTGPAAGCGLYMPQMVGIPYAPDEDGGGGLADSDRDTVRRWIAQGAMNN